jgi:hypothetical protein
MNLNLFSAKDNFSKGGLRCAGRSPTLFSDMKIYARCAGRGMGYRYILSFLRSVQSLT